MHGATPAWHFFPTRAAARVLKQSTIGRLRRTRTMPAPSAWVDHAEGRTAGTEKRRDRRVVAAVVNVRGLPYVIPDSVPPTGEESDEQTSAYRKEDERRGSETGPRGRRPTATGRRGERRLPHPGRRW